LNRPSSWPMCRADSRLAERITEIMKEIIGHDLSP
jgi:hypothetical protein